MRRRPDDDTTDSPLGVLGRRRRPPFARLLGSTRRRERRRDRRHEQTGLRTRARRIARLGGDGRRTADTRLPSTRLSYLRLADLLGRHGRNPQTGGDAGAGTTPSPTEASRLLVTRRITVAREVDVPATESGRWRPTGAGDRPTTLAHPAREGEDRRESPSGRSEPTGTDGADDSDRRQRQSDRRQITTLRSTQLRSAVASPSRAVRSVTRGRRSVAVSASAVGPTAETATDDRASTADAALVVPAERSGVKTSDDARSGFGTSASDLSASSPSSVGTAPTGDADGATGVSGLSGPLGADSAETTQATTPTVAATTVSDSPRLVVASRGSAPDSSAAGDGSATGGRTAAESGDPTGSGTGSRGRTTDSPDAGGSSAVEPASTPAQSASRDRDPVSLPSATVDRIVDRLSRRLQRDRRIARERGER